MKYLIATCLATVSMLAFSAADQPEPRMVLGLAFSPDGKSLAVATGGLKETGDVALWNVATRKAVWIHQQKMGIPAVAFAPDGQTVAIALYDQAAKLLEVADGKERATLKHPSEVRAVAFSPDGKLLATACWDGGVRIWDLANQTETNRFGGPVDRLRGVQFSPDGKLLMSTGGRDGIRLWDVASGVAKSTLKHGAVAYAAQITPDGNWLLSGSNEGSVRLWDLRTGEARASFGGGATYGIDYSRQARAFAVCTVFGHDVRVFDLPLGQPSPADIKQIHALIAKLDNASYDVRESASKEFLKIGFAAEADLARAAKEAVSAEVRIRARVVREQILSEPRVKLYGHTDQVECVAFAPDGKLLASGGRDGTVRIWDLATNKEIGKFVGN